MSTKFQTGDLENLRDSLNEMAARLNQILKSQRVPKTHSIRIRDLLRRTFALTCQLDTLLAPSPGESDGEKEKGEPFDVYRAFRVMKAIDFQLNLMEKMSQPPHRRRKEKPLAILNPYDPIRIRWAVKEEYLRFIQRKEKVLDHFVKRVNWFLNRVKEEEVHDITKEKELEKDHMKEYFELIWGKVTT